LSSTINNRMRSASSIDRKISSSHEPSQIVKQGSIQRKRRPV
jgi:hypothetical protein